MFNFLLKDRDRIAAMISELGGVIAENTKMEMLSTHFVSVLPSDTFTGMMVCALATGKWLLHVSFVYDSFRCKKFLNVSTSRLFPICIENVLEIRNSEPNRSPLHERRAQF